MSGQRAARACGGRRVVCGSPGGWSWGCWALVAPVGWGVGVPCPNRAGVCDVKPMNRTLVVPLPRGRSRPLLPARRRCSHRLDIARAGAVGSKGCPSPGRRFGVSVCSEHPRPSADRSRTVCCELAQSCPAAPRSRPRGRLRREGSGPGSQTHRGLVAARVEASATGSRAVHARHRQSCLHMHSTMGRPSARGWP
jgi:hypothetical protein